jgi:hypothetical protein
VLPACTRPKPHSLDILPSHPVPPTRLVHQYNVIGNENLPCNFLFFIIIFLFFLPFQISVNTRNFCSCDVARYWLNDSLSCYCGDEVLLSGNGVRSFVGILNTCQFRMAIGSSQRRVLFLIRCCISRFL